MCKWCLIRYACLVVVQPRVCTVAMTLFSVQVLGCKCVNSVKLSYACLVAVQPRVCAVDVIKEGVYSCVQLM